jgi:hypothetical protein
VREGDVAGEDRVVAGHVGLRIVTSVLELDVHPGAKLLEIELAPDDADRVADPARLRDADLRVKRTARGSRSSCCAMT